MTARLSPSLLPTLRRRTDLLTPSPALLDLPERVVQFGTGALLRGLVEPSIEYANRDGHFGGRIVVVSQTQSGRGAAFNAQHGLYTLRVQGVEEGRPVRRTEVVTAVSRALSAQDAWPEVLNVARQAEIELVISNTTEVGISWDEHDDANAAPPRSFPARLAAFLYARAEAFDFADEAGVVVLPCELIEDNGERLRQFVLQWGQRANFDERFDTWVTSACRFPNTLVDRIVPGTPDADRHHKIEAELGYRDALLTECEVYRLWAIEGDDDLRRRLSFVEDDARGAGIIVVPDVAPYRLRKVRILNGTHTLMVPVALACGLQTVQQAVEDNYVGAYIRQLLFSEVVPTVEAEGCVPPGSAETFAMEVLDRFANPFIRHELSAITLQHTAKLSERVVPTVLAFARATGGPPEAIAFGFAAYLLMQRSAAGFEDVLFGAGDTLLADDFAGYVRQRWNHARADDSQSIRGLVRDVLAHEDLWGADLGAIPGFADAVSSHLSCCLKRGVPAALSTLLATDDRPIATNDRAEHASDLPTSNLSDLPTSELSRQ